MEGSGPPVAVTRQQSLLGGLTFWQWATISLLLSAAVGMMSCGMGTTELPSATQPGGPGFLSITTPQLVDGVEGLSYIATINTSGGSGVITSCIIISGSLPPGFAAPSPRGSECILSSNGEPITQAGQFTFTLQAGDSSTPQRTDRRLYSLTIRNPFTVHPYSMPDGIMGRSYTRTFLVTTDLVNNHGISQMGSSQAGNGPITACSISDLPAAFTAAGGAATCAPDTTGVNMLVTMKAPAGNLLPGIYTFSLRVTDSPLYATNQPFPVVPSGTETFTNTLTVRNEFAITQTSLADGVAGRTFGVAPLSQPAQTSLPAVVPSSNSGQSGEAGNGPLTNCSLAVAPVNPGLSVLVDPGNRSRCLLTSTSPVTASGTYSVTISATDSPITDPASPAQIVVPQNTVTKTLTWVVNPPLAFSLNFDSPAGQPGQAPDAVENRTYGAPARSSLVVTATNGLSTTTGLSITVGGMLPAGVTCATPTPNPQPPAPTAILTCSSNGQPVGSSPGSTSFTVTVSDPGNPATPGGLTSTDVNGHTSHIIRVDAPLALAVNLPDPLPVAIQNRGYGIQPFSPILYTATGGLGGYYFSTPGTSTTPAAAFPQGFACTQGTGSAVNTYACSASQITATPSSVPYGPVPVTVDDTANATTPDGVSSGTTATQTRTLVVNPQLTITPNSAGNQPPPAVQNRSYGNAAAGFTPLTSTITGGVPPYTFSLPPTVAKPLSPGPQTPNGGVPTPITCTAPSPPQPQPPLLPVQVTCSSGTGVLTAEPGPYGFQFTVSDSGSAEAPAGSSSFANTITVNKPLALTPDSSLVDPPPPGVQGRAYGDPSQGLKPLIYDASGGNPPYVYTLPPATSLPLPNGVPVGIVCSNSSTAITCSTTGKGTVSASSGAYSFSFTLNDTASATTPSAQQSNTEYVLNKTLTIEPALELTGPATPLVPAVSGRTYGVGNNCGTNGASPCQPIQYTVTGGLGGYSTTLSMSNGFSCSLTSSSGLTGTYQCSSSSGVTGSGSSSLTITASDTANASTPAGTATSPSATLTINPALNISGPGSLATAVAGRSYGTGNNCGTNGTSPCQPIQYTVTGGLGGYSPTPSMSNGFSCSLTSSSGLTGTYQCSSSDVTGSGSPSLTITASDTANASTPAGSARSSAATLTINPEISITATPASFQDGVNGRAYGVGSNCGTGGTDPCEPLTFTASDGLGPPYNFSTTSPFPSGFSCATSGTPVDTYTCSAKAVGTAGSFSPQITVSDNANTSTPSNSKTFAGSLLIQPELKITTTRLANALLDYPYQQMLFATGGLGGYTWVAPGGTQGACSGSLAPTGKLPTDILLAPASGMLSAPAGSSSASVKDSDFTFQVCAMDAGNASTPVGGALTPNPPTNYVVNVFNPYAYVADVGQGLVHFINTGTPSSPPSTSGTALPIPLPGLSSTPNGIAVTPDGHYLYVALTTTNQFAVIDTITNQAIEGSPFSFPSSISCVSPVVVVGIPFPSNEIYFACDGNSKTSPAVAVIITDNKTGIASISLQASSMALTPDGKQVYVTLAGTGQFAVIDTSTNAQITGSPFSFPKGVTCTTPQGVAITPDGSRVYFACSGSDNVAVLTTGGSPTAIASISTGPGSQPVALAITPDGARVYVALKGTDQFTVIDNTQSTPAEIKNSPFYLPNPQGSSGTSSPSAVVIPPLDKNNLPSKGYRIFFTSNFSTGAEVDVIDDNGGTPIEDSVITVGESTSALTAIAAIPVPQ